jgi:hypothetical protein
VNSDDAQFKATSRDWPSLTLQGDALAMLELTLRGFATRADSAAYSQMHSFPVPTHLASRLQPGNRIALRDREGLMLAAMHVLEIREVLGTPYVNGTITPLQLPPHYSFAWLRQAAEELRGQFEIAFLATQPIHRPTFDALMATGKKTLILGALPPDADPCDTYSTVRCWLANVEKTDGRMGLSLWPLPAADLPEGRPLALAVAESCGCPTLLSRLDLPGAADHEEVVRLLREGSAVPESLTFPEVARELKAT